jgi:hypothetical protein
LDEAGDGHRQIAGALTGLDRRKIEVRKVSRHLGEGLGQNAPPPDILPYLAKNLEHPPRFRPLDDGVKDLKDGETGADQNQKFLVEGKKPPPAEARPKSVRSPQKLKTPFLDIKNEKTLLFKAFPEQVAAGSLVILLDDPAVGGTDFTMEK